MANVIRWGIIGTGDVAERKGGPALYQAERSELVAVTNRTPQRAEQFAERHGNPRVYATVESLLADPQVDAIYVATPPNTHASLTEQAAKAGKHVLCEKPMAMHAEETQRMIKACQANQVSLSIAYYRRAFPVVRKLKTLLEDQAIGRPLSVHIDNYTPFINDALAMTDPPPWRIDVAVSGGGMLMDVGSHRLDLLTYLFGMPTEIRGFAASQSLSSEVDDAAAAAFRFADGVLGTARFHWNTPIARDDFTVVGTEGLLSIHDLSGQAQLTLERPEGKELWNLPAPSPVHLPLVNDVVDHLLDGTENPCSGEAGALVNDILESLQLA